MTATTALGKEGSNAPVQRHKDSAEMPRLLAWQGLEEILLKELALQNTFGQTYQKCPFD